MSTEYCIRSVGCTAQCAAPSDQLQPAVSRQLGQATLAEWCINARGMHAVYWVLQQGKEMYDGSQKAVCKKMIRDLPYVRRQ